MDLNEKTLERYWWVTAPRRDTAGTWRKSMSAWNRVARRDWRFTEVTISTGITAAPNEASTVCARTEKLERQLMS